MGSTVRQNIAKLCKAIAACRHNIAFKLGMGFAFFAMAVIATLLWSIHHFFPQTLAAINSPRTAGNLIVLIAEAPTIYDQDHNGHYTGFEYDLILAFAKQQGLSIRFVEVKNLSEAYDMLVSGQAHLAAIRLPKPEPWSPWAHLAVSRPYMITDFAVVSRQREKITPVPDFWLTQEVAIAELSPAAWFISQHGEHFKDFSDKWAFEQSAWRAFDRVARGDSELTVTDIHTFRLVRHVFSYLTADEPLIVNANIGFIFSTRISNSLIDQVNFFIEQSQQNGLILKLRERHFGDLLRLSTQDISTFTSRIETTLPYYMSIFKEAEKKTGLDWRLIAALAYQESNWDPEAVSYTSVKGFMMLTSNTAKELGVTDRDNAQQSILAGAQYLVELKSRLPSSIIEPERTWMALAAYNLGYRGLSVGWQLAEQKEANASNWHELKPILPQLPRSKLIQDLGIAKVRGGEAVILVERVRAFYRILCLIEPNTA